MAILLCVNVREVVPSSPGENVLVKCTLQKMDGSYREDDLWTDPIALGLTNTQLNVAIAAWAKQYTIDHFSTWGLTYTPILDVVRVTMGAGAI